MERERGREQGGSERKGEGEKQYTKKWGEIEGGMEGRGKRSKERSRNWQWKRGRSRRV